MKKFTEQINERLKLNKDTKIKDSLSGVSLDDIKKGDEFKCITIEKNAVAKLNFTNLDYNLVCDEEPEGWFNYTYKIMVHWEGENNTNPFELYYYQNIKSSFFILFNDEHIRGNIFVLFKDSDKAQFFIDNYDNYRDEMLRICDDHTKNIK